MANDIKSSEECLKAIQILLDELQNAKRSLISSESCIVNRSMMQSNLFYLRDKKKREVDFLVVRDGEPWFLVEVKKSDESISPNLAFYQKATGARHAFQVVYDAPYVDVDCFSRTDPVVVPARTFLSQLL